MQKNLKTLILALIVLVSTTALSVLAQTWSTPPANPPSCPTTGPDAIAGCNPPINTTATAQAKLGGLTIGSATLPPANINLSVSGIIDTGGLITNQLTLQSAGNVAGKMLGAISGPGGVYSGAVGSVTPPPVSNVLGTQDCYLMRSAVYKALYVAPDGFYVKGSFGDSSDESDRHIFMMCRIATTPDDPTLPSASTLVSGLLASCVSSHKSDAFGLDAYCGYSAGGTFLQTYPPNVGADYYNAPTDSSMVYKGKLYPTITNASPTPFTATCSSLLLPPDAVFQESSIRWTVTSSGGVGNYFYNFTGTRSSFGYTENPIIGTRLSDVTLRARTTYNESVSIKSGPQVISVTCPSVTTP
jgi:hypothetical protein